VGMGLRWEEVLGVVEACGFRIGKRGLGVRMRGVC